MVSPRSLIPDPPGEAPPESKGDQNDPARREVHLEPARPLNGRVERFPLPGRGVCYSAVAPSMTARKSCGFAASVLRVVTARSLEICAVSSVIMTPTASWEKISAGSSVA